MHIPKKKNTFVSKLLPVLIGLVLLGWGAARLHTNFNGGQYYGGRGWVVIESCHPAPGYYDCSGTFRQNGGMITVNDATIKLEQSYQKGDTIASVFATYTHQDGQISGARLQTIGQRHSLGHNFWNSLAVIVGLLLITSPFSRWIHRRRQPLETGRGRDAGS